MRMSVQDGHRRRQSFHLLFAHSRGGSLGVRPGRTHIQEHLLGEVTLMVGQHRLHPSGTVIR